MPVNLKNIDLNLLVIFEAIYATANISRAAERLGMSQPAVSHSLARLREQLDDQLFVRAQNGVQPTIKARELIGPAREALGVIKRHFDDRSEIDLATYKRIFRVIMADPLEPIIMPPIIRTLMSQAPHIQIECIQANGQFSEGIKNGTIDIACFSFPVDTTDIVVEAICPFDLVLICRRGHPEIEAPLDFKTFQGLTQIALGRELRGLTNVDRSLIAHGTPRKIAYMAAKIWSIPPLVERTDMVAMLPRRFVKEIEHNFELDVHELPIEMPEQYAYMMWHANNNLDPGHIWLRESMMQAARSNAEPA
ncbi:MAG: LysR family transcriptional regulator [Rhodopseudomonas sp.]|nr:LysR family transcriptional regulator [Rhodopseudomonas sp.]